MQNHIIAFKTARQALADVFFSIEEAYAVREQRQVDLFGAFKASIIEACKGNAAEIAQIMRDEFTRLDEWHQKTLLKAVGFFKGKEKSVKAFFSKGEFKACALNSLDYTAFAESLENPFTPRPKAVTPPKSEVDKAIQALKTARKKLLDAGGSDDVYLAGLLSDAIAKREALQAQNLKAGESLE